MITTGSVPHGTSERDVDRLARIIFGVILKKLDALEILMGGVTDGLSQLQNAEADVEAAVSANTAAVQQVAKALADDTKQIADLTAQLSALQDLNPQAAAIAAELEKVAVSAQANTATLTAAVPAPAPAG